jgi:hypothetical protein
MTINRGVAPILFMPYFGNTFMSSFGFDPFALAKDLAATKKTPPNERLINGASLGKLSEVREALDDGAEPDFARLDIAPSLIATIRSHLDCLEEVLSRGGHADVANTAGWTALHEASIKETSEVLDVILLHPDSVDMTVQDNDGNTALMAALQKNRLETANKLVEVCPHLLAIENELGVTPIFWAVQHKDEEWLDWVLEHDANASIRQLQGKTALEVAEESGWTVGATKLVGLSAQSSAEVAASVAAAAKILGRQDLFAPFIAPAELVVVAAEQNPEPEKPAANPFGLGGIRRSKP